MPVGDVAVSQARRSHQGLIRKVDFVMGFVTVAQALEHLDRIFDARFLYVNGSKAALQGGVLLDVFVIFVQRGRADALQFTARQGRFEHVARIQRALGCSRADDRV